MPEPAGQAERPKAAPVDPPEHHNMDKPADFLAHAHPIQAVACPDCAARVGTWCKRPSGHKATTFHKRRCDLADSVWEQQGARPIYRTPKGWSYDPADAAP